MVTLGLNRTSYIPSSPSSGVVPGLTHFLQFRSIRKSLNSERRGTAVIRSETLYRYKMTRFFLQIPPELIIEIAESIKDHQDVVAFALTSKLVYSCCTPVRDFYVTLVFDSTT